MSTQEPTTAELNREAFLEVRRSGIGSSDVPAIMGVDKWASPRDIWDQKLGVADEVPPNEDMLRGTDQEPIAAERYAKATRRRIRRRGLVRAKPPNEHAIAHIDRHIIAEPADDGPGILEVKCPRFPKWLEIDRQGANLYMIYQVQHQMACTGWSWARYAIYHGELGLRIFEMEAAPLIQQQIMDHTRAFWNDYVLTRTPPPDREPVELDIPDEMRDANILQTGDSAWHHVVDRYRTAKALSTEAKKLLEHAEGLVKDYMESQAVDAIEGFGLRCYHRLQDGRRTTDKPALRAAGLLEPAAVQTALLEAARSGLIDSDTSAALIKALKDCRANIDSYVKQGKPFRSLRPYWLTEEK